MSQEMRIRIRPVPVEVELSTRVKVTGEVFLHDGSSSHAGGETIADLMNGPAPFFPLRVTRPEAQTLLVAKMHVKTMRVPPLRTDERIAALRKLATRLELVLNLDGDETLSGVVYADCPPLNVRALDFLNSSVDRFVLLVQQDRDCLVGRAHIVHVRDHDPAIDRPLAPEPGA